MYDTGRCFQLSRDTHSVSSHGSSFLREQGGLQRRQDWAKFSPHSELPHGPYALFCSSSQSEQNNTVMNCPLPSLDSTSCVARLEQEGDTGLKKAVILFSAASPSTLLLRVAVAGSLASWKQVWGT